LDKINLKKLLDSITANENVLYYWSLLTEDVNDNDATEAFSMISNFIAANENVLYYWSLLTEDVNDNDATEAFSMICNFMGNNSQICLCKCLDGTAQPGITKKGVPEISSIKNSELIKLYSNHNYML